MKPTRGAMWTCAATLALVWTGSAHAGWDNVFQVTCWWRKDRPATSYYYAPPVAYAAAPACSSCAPQPACSTSYVQRSYYQPVTHYETRSYYEPVTTYRTSYYYEPVTTVHYSSYYDACSCSYQQVATPTTSYRLREQSCPVQAWVQRCTSVPVTNYQQSFYYEPVTSCCAQPTSCCASAPAPASPGCCGSTPPAIAPQAGVSEQSRGATPGVNEYQPRGNSDGQTQRFYPQQSPPPPVNGSSTSQPMPNSGTTGATRVHLDRVVALPEASAPNADSVFHTSVRLRLVSDTVNAR